MKPKYRPEPMRITSINFDRIDTLRVSDFMDSDDWKLRKVEEFDNCVEHDNVGIFSIHNLEVGIQDGGDLVLTIPGHVYIIDVNQSFFHATFDNFGQYLAIKKYFPEIKPIAILGEFPHENNDYLNSNYKKHILELCGIDVNDVVHYPMFNKIVFERVSFITKSCNNITFGILDALNRSGKDLPMDINWSEKTKQLFLISRALKEFMLEHNHSSTRNRSRKIFISRKSRSKVFKKNHDLIQFLKDNGVTWELDNPSKMHDPNGITKTNLDRFHPASPTDNLQEVQHRYMPIDQETLIENYFMHLGYDLVDVDAVPLTEQMDLFSNCTHIATITGAGSLNSMYLEDGGTMVLIANNSDYTFYHEDLVSLMVDNPVIVFDKRKVSGQFTAKEIIEELKQNHLDRL